MVDGYFAIGGTAPGPLARIAGRHITLCQSLEEQDTCQRQDTALVLELLRQTCEPTITAQGAVRVQLKMDKYWHEKAG